MNSVLPAAVALLSAFACSVAGIRAGLPFAGRIAMAAPVARSSHKTPIPQSGGLFVIGAVTLACILAAAIAGGDVRAEWLWLCPVLLLAAIGWLDDRIGLSAITRLLAYILVSAASVIFGLIAPLSLTGVAALDAIIAIGLLVVFVNITNFMDGIDGMVVVEYAPALLLLGLTALAANEAPSAFRSLSLLGALAGFFVYNRPKAKIFLGDSGSVAVGFMACVLLLGYAHAQGLVAALILPLYFLADAGLTLARRVLKRERFWEGHRQHFYQRALDSGQSNWSILGRIAACNAALCGLSLAAATAEPVRQFAMLAAAAGLVAVLLLSLMRAAR